MSDTYLYLIGSPSLTLAKIGHAKDPVGRLRELQIGSPVGLLLLWTRPASSDAEWLMHREFERLRRHGEWFDFAGLDPVSEVSAAADRLEILEGREMTAASRPPLPGRRRRRSFYDMGDLGVVIDAPTSTQLAQIRAMRGKSA